MATTAAHFALITLSPRVADTPGQGSALIEGAGFYAEGELVQVTGTSLVDARGRLRHPDLMQLPPHLDGHAGENRDDPGPGSIKARDDLAAIATFLRQFPPGSRTLINYSLELRRLLVYATQVRGVAFSSLSYDDLEAYPSWLFKPTGTWCSKDGRSRPRPGDRALFVRGLSKSSVNTSFTVVASLYRWLHAAGYIRRNTMDLFSDRKKLIETAYERCFSEAEASEQTSDNLAEEMLQEERYLQPAEIEALKNAIDAMPGGANDKHRHLATSEQIKQYERVRFLFMVLFMCAPRVADVVKARMIHWGPLPFPANQDELYWAVKKGKGGKDAILAVPPALVAARTRFRKMLGLPEYVLDNEPTALIPALGNWAHRGGDALYQRSITRQRIDQILKDVGARAARMLRDQDPSKYEHMASHLERMSAHWWRHTGLSHMSNEGGSDRTVMEQARHSDSRTTEIYKHSNLKRRYAEVADLMDFDWGALGREK